MKLFNTRIEKNIIRMFKKLTKTVSFSKGNSKSKTDDSLEAVVGFQIILNPNDNATSNTSGGEFQ